MEDSPTAQSSRRWWERLESASEVALLVGCFLVVAGLVFEDWVATFRISGEVAVIVGVMIEGLADGGIFLAAGRLRLIQDAELERMRLETAQANARAAEANQRAAEADAKTEKERVERMKIEEKIAWRTLSLKQWESIASKLRWNRPKNSVPIWASRNDAEIMSFANSLGNALQIANWPITGGRKSYFDRIVVGVWIEYRQDADATDMDRANLLVEVLRAEGIDVSGPRPSENEKFTADFSNFDPTSPVQILVGEKP
jgi:hypothetical protein